MNNNSLHKVKITSDGTPYGHSVFCSETGKRIDNVNAVEIALAAGDISRVTLHLSLLSTELEGFVDKLSAMRDIHVIMLSHGVKIDELIEYLGGDVKDGSHAS